MPTLDIVIVNWNAGPRLRACLESLARADHAAFRLARVVVVDNASSDESLDGLSSIDLPVTVERNTVNRGFAAGCNQGARGGVSDYVLFLNPDTTVFADSLVRPIAFMEDRTHADVGICGVRLTGDDGGIVVSCARFPTVATFLGQASGLTRLWPRRFPPHLMSASECRATRDVDQIIGAFFLVRRRLYDAVQGFDERFFMYFEEVDFSLRARQLGYRSVFLAETAIYHRGGTSSEQVKAARLFYSLRSRIQYGFKHYRRRDALLLVAITFGIEFAARLLRAAAQGSVRELGEVTAAYLSLSRHLGRRASFKLTERITG